MDAELLRMAKEFGKAMAEAQYKHFTEMTKTQKVINEANDIKGRGGDANALNPGERRDDSITKAIDKFEQSVDKFYTASKEGHQSKFGNAKGIAATLYSLASSHSATAWATQAGREMMRSRMFAEAEEMRNNATGQEKKIYDRAIKDIYKYDPKKSMVARTEALKKETEAANSLYHSLLDLAKGVGASTDKLATASKAITGSSLGDIIAKRLSAQEKIIYDKTIKEGIMSDDAIKALGNEDLIRDAETFKKAQQSVLQRIEGFATEAANLTKEQISSLSELLLKKSIGEGDASAVLDSVTTSFMPAIKQMFKGDEAKLKQFTSGLGGKGNVAAMTEAHKKINSGMKEMSKFVDQIGNLEKDGMSKGLTRLNNNMQKTGSNFNSVMHAVFQEGAEGTIDRIKTIFDGIETLNTDIIDLKKEGLDFQADAKEAEKRELIAELNGLTEKMTVMSTSINNANKLLDPSLKRTDDDTKILSALENNSHVISDSSDVGMGLTALLAGNSDNFGDLIVALSKSTEQTEDILNNKSLSDDEKRLRIQEMESTRDIFKTWLGNVDDSLKLNGKTTIEGITSSLTQLANGTIGPEDLDSNFDLSPLIDAIRDHAKENGVSTAEAVVDILQKKLGTDTVSAIKDDHLQAKAKEVQNRQARAANTLLDGVELYGVKLGTILESIGFSLSASREEMMSNIWQGTKWGMGIALAGATQLWSDGAYAIRGQIEEQRRWQAATMGMSNKELLTGMMVYRDTLRKMASEQGISFDDLDIEQLQDMGKKYAISGEEAFHYGLRLKEATQLTALGSKANLEQMSDFYANSARLLNMTVDEFGEQFSEMANDPGLVAFMNVMKGAGPNMQTALARELTTRIKVNKVLGQSNEQMKERMRIEAGQKYSGIEAFIRRQVGTSMEMDTLSEVSGIDFSERDKYLAGLNPNDMTQGQRLEWEKSGRVKYETAYAVAAEKHTKALENASTDEERGAINAEYRTVMTMLEQFRAVHGQPSLTDTADAKYNTIAALLSGTELEGKAADVISGMLDWTNIRGSLSEDIANKLETTLGFNEQRIEAGDARQAALGIAENASGIVQSGIGKVLGGILFTLGNILAQHILTNWLLRGGPVGAAVGATASAAKGAVGGAALTGMKYMLGTAGKVLGGTVAVGMAVKDVADITMDAIDSEETVKKEDTYALAGSVGGAATGALIGGLLGSVIPVAGTAAGATMGAWLGAGIGNWWGESEGIKADIKDATTIATGDVTKNISKDVKQILDKKLTDKSAQTTLDQYNELHGSANLTEAITENTETVKKSTQSYKEQTNKHGNRLDQFVNQITTLTEKDFGPGVEDFARSAAFQSTFG